LSNNISLVTYAIVKQVIKSSLWRYTGLHVNNSWNFWELSTRFSLFLWL
jgi:hypothetical protein